jgi:D-inositol-3-phosphate glycosyltransferase
VTFLPPQSRENLATVFQTVDLVAVPSYSESFGLVAVEAQACGTPVAAAAVGGLPVAVRDGVTGALVAGHDADRWAQALDGLLQADAGAMSRAAVEHAATFSWDNTVDSLLASYRHAIGGFTARRSVRGIPSARRAAAPGRWPSRRKAWA